MEQSTARRLEAENDVPEQAGTLQARKRSPGRTASRAALTDLSNRPRRGSHALETSSPAHALTEPSETTSDNKRESAKVSPEASNKRRHDESPSRAERDASLGPDAKRRRVARIPLVENVPHDDLSAMDNSDPLLVDEYAEDIYALMYERQDRYVVHPSYMSRQPELQWSLRGVLMNWLVTVHTKFRLLPETLLLATNLVDRYLDGAPEAVPLGELQLVGVTALFMAAKYEEVYVPSVQNYSYVANFTDNEVRVMERRMLAVLDFDFGYVNPINFLRRVSKADDYNLRSRTVAKFLLEMSIFDKKLATFRPSDVAAAAMLLARDVLSMGTWTNNFVHYSGGCTREALKPITDAMTAFIGDGLSQYPDFHRKYASKKFLRASILCVRWYEEHVAPIQTESSAGEA